MIAPSAPSGPTSGQPAADGAARTGRRPVVLGALGAAVLAAAGLLLLTGGPDATDAAIAAAPTAATTASPAASASAAPPAPSGAPAAGRDPFEPLLSASSAAEPVDAGVQAPAGAGSGAAPAVMAQGGPVPSASAAAAARTLVLQTVEVAGEQRTAVFALGGATLRAQVGASFGPEADLLLLSLQQEPGGGRWTAVVQRGDGDPFDLTTGSHAHLP